MNEIEFKTKLSKVVLQAKQILEWLAPVRSGNLQASIKLISTARGYKIYIDDNQAPYDMYTNEKWISPRWGGRANPNEGWIEEALELIIAMIEVELGSVVKRSD